MDFSQAVLLLKRDLRIYAKETMKEMITIYDKFLINTKIEV